MVLKTSNTGLIEVEEEGKKIRRSPKLPVREHNEERQQQLIKSTVYCKGFDKENTTLDELLDFFKPEEGVMNCKRLSSVSSLQGMEPTSTVHLPGRLATVPYR